VACFFCKGEPAFSRLHSHFDYSYPNFLTERGKTASLADVPSVVPFVGYLANIHPGFIVSGRDPNSAILLLARGCL
jgi:hypothetical protein